MTRLLRYAIFLLAVASSAPYGLIALAVSDPSSLREVLAARAEPEPRGVTSFLEGVRHLTKNGDSIALLVPVSTWDDGYAYIYYRASYILSGRVVIPLIDSHNARHPERLAAAEYVAAWRVPVPTSFEPVSTFAGGVLARRMR